MSSTFACGCSFAIRSRIFPIVALVDSTGCPRSPSFAPVSTTITAAGRFSTQSRRRSSPAAVSPLTPAFTTSIDTPAESSLRWINCGYALSGSSPSPAVSDVPRNTIAGRATRVDARGESAAVAACTAWALLCVVGLFSLEPLLHAVTAVASSTAHALVSALMLQAVRLTKEYQSGEHRLAVLRDVSFSVPDGAFVAIVGPSGSGKTTLLGLLAGLDVPSSGTVLLDDTDLGKLSEDKRAQLRGAKVGFVFQSFQLIPTLTALENVQVPLELRGDGGAPARARELLGRVGLADRAHHFPVELSAGEQQRVAIARAFSNAPSLLFADEPTGNLDSDTGHHIVELLETLNRESGTTIVLVTHDLALARRAQRVIRLADGAVVSDAPAAVQTTE